MEKRNANIGDGSLIFHRLVSPARYTPAMMGNILRMCFPVELNPTIVKIPPIVGPFKSPPAISTRSVAIKPFTAIFKTVAGPPLSLR